MVNLIRLIKVGDVCYSVRQHPASNNTLYKLRTWNVDVSLDKTVVSVSSIRYDFIHV